MADPSLEVRAAEPSDLPDIHSSVFASGRAAVLPLFQAVFRKGWDMYLRATGLAVLVLVFFVIHPEWQTNGLQLLGLAVLCFSAVFFLTLVFIWTQMEKESGRSVAGDLSHVHGSSSGKSYCWVVTRPQQPEGKFCGGRVATPVREAHRPEPWPRQHPVEARHQVCCAAWPETNYCAVPQWPSSCLACPGQSGVSAATANQVAALVQCAQNESGPAQAAVTRQGRWT
ncbi:hypothetical protein HaLaN_02782 [Haematococcus lacustris]|uniref:Uncharacterized protein n=1 Tax=Haematococcus lacustris TaxID=44745 RepID=A0A699YLX1_HAELA|nr:hypothetical protein HaLaN_02782 [Haematococcus lacustris]